jgi:hypothetical protein
LEAKLEAADMSTEAKRSAIVLEVRDKFRRKAESVSRMRKVIAFVTLGIATAFAVHGTWKAAREAHRHEPLSDSTRVDLSDSLTLAITGTFGLLMQAPIERTRSLYERNQEAPFAERQGSTAAAVSPKLTASTVGFVFGLGAKF